MTSHQSTFRIPALIAAVVLGILSSNLARAEERPAPRPKTDGEFFIISSVDVKEAQIVLKRPTEVTELIHISEKTAYLNEDGKKIEFKNLRAGDTVWIKFNGNTRGVRTANVIRKGPMTVEELRRRYLKFE